MCIFHYTSIIKYSAYCNHGDVKFDELLYNRSNDYCQGALKSTFTVPRSDNEQGFFTLDKATAWIIKGDSFSYQSLTDLYTKKVKNYSGVSLVFVNTEDLTKENENVSKHKIKSYYLPLHREEGSGLWRALMWTYVQSGHCGVVNVMGSSKYMVYYS